jgi:hypothetical protein
MKRSKVFKVIAITNFVVLLSIFLLYSSGSFNKYFYNSTGNSFTSSNGGVGVKPTVESARAAYDSLQKLQRMRASSSKSLVVRDFIYDEPRRTVPKKDSTPVDATDKQKEMMERSKPELMYSSKSGLILNPKLFTLDSLLTEKEKQKKQQ